MIGKLKNVVGVFRSISSQCCQCWQWIRRWCLHLTQVASFVSVSDNQENVQMVGLIQGVMHWWMKGVPADMSCSQLQQLLGRPRYVCFSYPPPHSLSVWHGGATGIKMKNLKKKRKKKKVCFCYMLQCVHALLSLFWTINM